MRFLGIIITAVIANYYLIIVIVILCVVFVLFRQYYLRMARTIKRIEASRKHLYIHRVLPRKNKRWLETNIASFKFMYTILVDYNIMLYALCMVISITCNCMVGAKFVQPLKKRHPTVAGNFYWGNFGKFGIFDSHLSKIKSIILNHFAHAQWQIITIDK